MTTPILTSRIGTYLTSIAGGESVRAFLPPPLPPNPPLDMASLYPLLDQAGQALGRLDGMAAALPDLNLFLYMYVRKEAVLSSQIEGTQSSLADLLMHENADTPGVPLDDVQEVSRYVDALHTGMTMMKDIPLSLRLIRETHRVLLSHGRGATKQPGEFRTSQNWIGGTRPGNAAFVPPPPQEVMRCLGDLENFIHDKGQSWPALIRAGMVHVQFETIHPFLDGNGRIGRLLITLMLCADGLMTTPLLYLSLYFKQNRKDYYRLLSEVRERGAWEAWLEFFLTGVRDTANQAYQAIADVQKRFEWDRMIIQTHLGRATPSALLIHTYFHYHPLATMEQIQKGTSLGIATVNRVVPLLIDRKILKETTGQSRNRVFVYDAYMEILSRGTDPL